MPQSFNFISFFCHNQRLKAEMAMIPFFLERLLGIVKKEMYWSALQVVSEYVGREDHFVKLEKGYVQG